MDWEGTPLYGLNIVCVGPKVVFEQIWSEKLCEMGYWFLRVQEPVTQFLVITGPVKLFCFSLEMEVSKGLKIV